MKLLDANIVIYSLGRDHPYRDPCRAIFSQLEENLHGYTIDTEMLQEVLFVFSKRGYSERGAEAVMKLLTLFPDAIPISGSDIEATARLVRQMPRLSIRDAVHAAVVFEHGLEGIVSADKAFDNIPGLRRYDPTEVAG